MKIVISFFVAALLAGCTTAALYDQVAAQTAPDCNKIANADERSRCKKETQTSYEEYERERQKAKTKQ
jgi:hypothetical protein